MYNAKCLELSHGTQKNAASGFADRRQQAKVSWCACSTRQHAHRI